MNRLKTTGQTLEISKIALPRKPVILRKFDSLKSGESMVIANEHNPYILFYQLLEDRGNIFTWEYLEKGPEKWRVRITKNPQDFQEPSVGEIAALDYKKAELFQRFGISYCCSGEKSLKDACDEAGISEEILEQFTLEAARQKGREVYAFERWEADFLTDYIINTHHSYLKDNMPMIYGMALTVAEQQEPKNPAITTLAGHLEYFFSALHDHMLKEEEEFFPLVRKITASKKKHGRLIVTCQPPLGERISKMVQEHKEIGDSLKFIKKLTDNYKLPDDAANTSTFLYAKLIEFENDLVQHIHLENNILFPKLKALEKDMEKTGN